MNSRNQNHQPQRQQEQAQQLAKHGVAAEQAGAISRWRVVGLYRTQGGAIGVEIRVSDRSRRFAYTGAWGAGSGLGQDSMQASLQTMLRGRRGVVAEIPFTVGG